jgi:hypothetical protein
MDKKFAAKAIRHFSQMPHFPMNNFMRLHVLKYEKLFLRKKVPNIFAVVKKVPNIFAVVKKVPNIFSVVIFKTLEKNFFHKYFYSREKVFPSLL